MVCAGKSVALHYIEMHKSYVTMFKSVHSDIECGGLMHKKRKVYSQGKAACVVM